MKLKSLAIKNIRSYRDLEISFPDGILLFEGGHRLRQIDHSLCDRTGNVRPGGGGHQEEEGVLCQDR